MMRIARDNLLVTCSYKYLLIVLLSQIKSARAENCLGNGQLAGVVLGTSLATLFLATTIAALIQLLIRKRRADDVEMLEKAVVEKGMCVNGTLELQRQKQSFGGAQFVDKMTSYEIPNMKEHLTALKRVQSDQTKTCESINTLRDVMKSLLDRDTNALGFDIIDCSDSIFINNVYENGPAHRSGNIFTGDKIRALTVSFEGMKVDDAIALLGCASAYKIKLELERAVMEESEVKTNLETAEGQRKKLKGSWRHRSLNLCPRKKGSFRIRRAKSWVSDQLYALPDRTSLRKHKFVDKSNGSAHLQAETDFNIKNESPSVNATNKMDFLQALDDESPLATKPVLPESTESSLEEPKDITDRISIFAGLKPAKIPPRSFSLSLNNFFSSPPLSTSRPEHKNSSLKNLYSDPTDSELSFALKDSSSIPHYPAISSTTSDDPSASRDEAISHISPSLCSVSSSISEIPASLATVVANRQSPSKIPLFEDSPKPVPLQIRRFKPESATIIEQICKEEVVYFVERSRFMYSKARAISNKHNADFCERIRFRNIPELTNNNSCAPEIISTGETERTGQMFLDSSSNNGTVKLLGLNNGFSRLQETQDIPIITDFQIEYKKADVPNVIERKLAPLPKSIQISSKMEKDAALLYVEQKAALRKTTTNKEDDETSGSKLGHEQLAKLAANRTLLERQQEELRALGILP